MQITDIQETPAVSPDTLRLLDAALEAGRPHLVVLTGDQLKGYDSRFQHNRPLVERTISAITRPIWSRGIPFAVTYGNHDRETGLDNREQDQIYSGLPGCLNGRDDCGPGTTRITVLGSREDTPQLAVYLLDSGGSLPGGGYQSVSRGKLRWLEASHLALLRETGGPLPAVAFQHIPTGEYQTLLRRADRYTSGSVRHLRGRHRGYWIRDRARCRREGLFREPVCCGAENSGEVDLLCRLPGMLALYCGHNHRNSFVGKYRGLDLGFTPSCGFSAYGLGVDRGVRLLTFREDSPGHYGTRLLTYRHLVGSIPSRPVVDWVYTHMPESHDAGRHLAGKLLLTAAVPVALCTAVSAYLHLSKRKK